MLKFSTWKMELQYNTAIWSFMLSVRQEVGWQFLIFSNQIKKDATEFMFVYDGIFRWCIQLRRYGLPSEIEFQLAEKFRILKNERNLPAHKNHFGDSVFKSHLQKTEIYTTKHTFPYSPPTIVQSIDGHTAHTWSIWRMINKTQPDGRACGFFVPAALLWEGPETRGRGMHIFVIFDWNYCKVVFVR